MKRTCQLTFALCAVLALAARAQSVPQPTITSPSDNTAVAPGEVLTITVDDSSPVQGGNSAILGQAYIVTSDPLPSAANNSFTVTLPDPLYHGTYTLTAVEVGPDGTVYSSAPIHIIVPRLHPLTALTIQGGIVALDEVGQQGLLNVVGTDGNGGISIVDGSEATFTVLNPQIATVDSTGLVTGVTAGETQVTASVGSLMGSARVSVGNPLASYPAASPTFQPASETLTAPQAVTISDSTPGAMLYYTLDGSIPSTTSTPYTGPITVASNVTIQAIAAADRYFNSAPASATYTFTAPPPPPAAAAPAFSPPAGTYTSTQTITITDATPGAAIYYTLDGSTPTASSTPYTAPITVNSTETINAIAIATGHTNSSVSFALYTISPGSSQCQTIDYSKGFTSSGLTLNGGATVTNSLLQLTDGKFAEARSAFFSQAVPVDSFTTDFTFQLLLPLADGITFTIQSNNPQEVGEGGGGLGYVGIPNSVAVKLDLFDNEGEGFDSTGLYINGAFPGTPAVSLFPAGIHLHSGHIFAVHIAYADGMAMATITDTATSQVASVSLPGNLSKVVGDTAYVGFTGGTGSLVAIQNILTWSFSGGAGCGTP